MARFRRTSGRRRRQRVIWDSFSELANNLPSTLNDELNVLDGAYTGIKRYSGTDITVMRSIIRFTVTIDLMADPADGSMMLRVCVGLSFFDSMQDVDGQAVNSTLLSGTGPLDDANNNRWFIRACVDIPIGFLFFISASATNMSGLVIPVQNGTLTVAGIDGTRKIIWNQFIDTKTRRKLQGIETPFLNVAMQASTDPTLAAAEDVACFMDSFEGRMVLKLP